MRDYFLIALSLILAGVAIIVFRRRTRIRYLRFPVAAVSFVLLMLSIAYGVSDYFTDSGINDAVIFHLKYGLGGAGFGEYSGLITTAAVLIVFSLFAACFVFIYISSRRTDHHKSPLFFLLGLSLLLIALIINPATSDLYHIFKQPEKDLREGQGNYAFDENFTTPDPVSLPSDPVNFIYIYLESFERTYFDEKVFPNLVPGLKSLEKESLSFSHLLQVTNTGWTIAGVTASQCGIPLVTTGKGNSMSKIDLFLPAALCIGDMLNDAGYSLHYMGGALLKFAGKGKFYKTHGFSDVRGLEELKDLFDEDVPVSEWGLYDPDLLLRANENFIELSEADKPFGLFLLTLDTHHPKGHIPSQCEGLVYGDGSNEMLNAVHCSDRVVSKFIQSVRESSYSDNTMIVVGSDHLAFRNLAYDKLSKIKRRNLFFINQPKRIEPGLVTKIGSTLDIGPTVMKQLGFDVTALGLGRDLVGQEQTIVEKKRGDIYSYLKSLNDDLMKLWDFPQLDYGLLITPGKALTIKFGDRLVRFPALISVSDDLKVENITFGDYSPHGTTDHVNELDADQLFIWVDLCRRVSPILVDSQDRLGRAVCVSSGSLDAEKINTHVIDTKEPLFLGRDKIAGIFSDVQKQNRPDDINYQLRKDRLADVLKPPETAGP